MGIKKVIVAGLFFLFYLAGQAQILQDTAYKVINYADSTLRIRNINPYFTLHVDSTLKYAFEINKDQSQYYWYLKNSPVGLKINKDDGLLTFKADDCAALAL